MSAFFIISHGVFSFLMYLAVQRLQMHYRWEIIENQ
nr:MAG TPA: hypothetical protein [Caudoviricetes sp.]